MKMNKKQARMKPAFYCLKFLFRFEMTYQISDKLIRPIQGLL